MCNRRHFILVFFADFPSSAFRPHRQLCCLCLCRCSFCWHLYNIITLLAFRLPPCMSLCVTGCWWHVTSCYNCARGMTRVSEWEREKKTQLLFVIAAKSFILCEHGTVALCVQRSQILVRRIYHGYGVVIDIWLSITSNCFARLA